MLKSRKGSPSVSYYCCFYALLSGENFAKGLKKLRHYENEEKITSPIYENTYVTISTFLSHLADLLNDPIPPEPEDDYDDINNPNFYRIRLVKNRIWAGVLFTPWLQQVFSFTKSKKYLFIKINFNDTKNQCFLPRNHRSFSFLREVFENLSPLVAWMKEDSAFGSLTYWYPYEPELPDIPFETSQTAPWHEISETYIIGSPLSDVVKSRFDLFDSGLYDPQVWHNDLVFISPPANPEYDSRYPDYKSERGKAHNAAAEKLHKVLQSISIEEIQKRNC